MTATPDTPVAQDPQERHVLNLSCRELSHVVAMVIFFEALVNSPAFRRILPVASLLEPKMFQAVMSTFGLLADTDKASHLKQVPEDELSTRTTSNIKRLRAMLMAQIKTCTLYPPDVREGRRPPL